MIASFIFVIKSVFKSKVKNSASAVVNEKMEEIRNMSYDQLSTISGAVLPHGTIPDEEIYAKNGTTLDVDISISFIDDSADGCAVSIGSSFTCFPDETTSATQDTAPYDYKRVHIEAKEQGSTLVLATLTTNIASKAAETPTNTGMILVKVIDANGEPVEGAYVTISGDGGAIVVSGYTTVQGYLFVSSLPPDSQNGYHIVATKDGYSTDYTTPRTSQNPNQNQPDVDVITQQTTIQTLSIDLLSDIKIYLNDTSSLPASGAAIDLVSSKITAINPSTPKNIYHLTTNSSGEGQLQDIEWDGYTLAIAGYSVVACSPYQPVTASPGVETIIYITVSTDSSWPKIQNIAPSYDAINASGTMTIDGEGLQAPAQIILRRSGQTDYNLNIQSIAPTKDSIVASYNLAGLASGLWDVVVVSEGKATTQREGFDIK